MDDNFLNTYTLEEIGSFIFSSQETPIYNKVMFRKRGREDKNKPKKEKMSLDEKREYMKMELPTITFKCITMYQQVFLKE